MVEDLGLAHMHVLAIPKYAGSISTIVETLVPAL